MNVPLTRVPYQPCGIPSFFDSEFFDEPRRQIFHFKLPCEADSFLNVFERRAALLLGLGKLDSAIYPFDGIVHHDLHDRMCLLD